MSSTAQTRQAILLFCPEWNGLHPGAWRLPEDPLDGQMNFEALLACIQKAERAKMHGFFLADPTGFWRESTLESLGRTATGTRFEPFTFASAVAMRTDHIGLLLTANTTFEEPYNIARRFASLDHLSGGRAGWNVVTVGNPSTARHFGKESMMEHGQRYERATEFIEATMALWDSYEDDAYVGDQESGIYYDHTKMHAAEIDGDHVALTGPLNSPRPIQGYPVIAQAGSSETGRDFAARFADIMFTLQPNVEMASAFYTDMKARAAAHGRDPDEIKILPALTIVVAPTDEEAEERFQRMDELVTDEVGLEMLSTLIYADLRGHDLDGPLPEIAETTHGTKTLQRFFLDKAERENLTIRQLISFMLRWGALGGSPTTIADHVEQWMTANAADGFNVAFADAHLSMDLFMDEVVPELQRRGIFQTEYQGKTLRENLGLTRPVNRFTAETVGV